MSVSISVILPTYNAGNYLRSAVNSIIDQTYSDFELLIYDDASTDGSTEFIEELSDPRVTFYKSEHNQGYAYRLNKGLDQARGKYIARMDADDECLPDRFEKQVSYLNQHPGIGLIGSDVLFIDENNKVLRLKETPKSDVAIRWEILLDNPFIHPSVMFRSELLAGGLRYERGIEPTEDFLMWSKMLQKTKGANLPDVLLHYRVHSNQISHQKKKLQAKHHDHVVKQNLKIMLDCEIPDSDRSHLISFVQGKLLDQYLNKSYFTRFYKCYFRLLGRFEASYKTEEGMSKVYRQSYALVYRSILKSSSFLSGLMQLIGAVFYRPSFFVFFVRKKVFGIKCEQLLNKN